MYNSIENCNLPDIVTEIPTPDFKMLPNLINNKTSIIIFFPGVGTTDIDYVNFCSRLAKELNALVICPNFSSGTDLHYLNVKQRRMEEYRYDIPMYTDNQERKDQNDIKSVECYGIIDVLRELIHEMNLSQNGKISDQNIDLPIHVVGHSFGGCSAVHMLCNLEERHKISKVVSLGGSISVGLDQHDWYNLLNTSEYLNQHQCLQIHEENFATQVGSNAIYSKLLVGDLISSAESNDVEKNWNSTLSNQKQQMICVKNSQHSDITDLETAFLPTGNFKFSEIVKSIILKLLKFNTTTKMQKIISFENQVDVTCKFLNGDNMKEFCQGNRFYEYGPIMAEKLDFNRIYGKIRRILKNGKKNL